MARYRFFAALLLCACLLTPALAAPAEDSPVNLPENDSSVVADQPSDFGDLPKEPVENSETVENSPSEVVVTDETTVYHIAADTIIIQPVDTSAGDSGEESPLDSDVDASDGAVEPSEDSDAAVLVPPEDPAPLPVVIVPDEEVFPSAAPELHDLTLDIDAAPPASPLFYGAVYVTGYDSRLGNITVYFPANYQSGVLGLDSSGCLVSVYSGSVSGYLSGVNNNRVTLSTWSRPTYSQYSGSSTATYTLNLRPVSSNADLMTSSLPRMSFQQLYPYFIILLLGVILCFMKRW